PQLVLYTAPQQIQSIPPSGACAQPTVSTAAGHPFNVTLNATSPSLTTTVGSIIEPTLSRDASTLTTIDHTSKSASASLFSLNNLNPTNSLTITSTTCN